MKLDWIQITLLVVAAWILYARNKAGDQAIDWPQLAAIAIISQVVTQFWSEA